MAAMKTLEADLSDEQHAKVTTVLVELTAYNVMRCCTSCRRSGRGWRSGRRSRPARELVVQTGLSRATVRDALRVLQVESLLRIKPGRAGGALVHRPDGDSVANSVRLVIQGQQLRLETVHETREVIEPACAALAARRRTDEDLAALDAANAEMLAAADDVPAFLRANVGGATPWPPPAATSS